MIYLILGPMYSGKTSELIRRYNRYKISGKRCLLVKNALDLRYSEDNKLCTHDMFQTEATICSSLHQIEKINQYDVICIDEIQFYPDNLDFCTKMANQGKIIIASGLSGNYKRQPFKNMPELTANAEKVVYLTAICMICKNDGAAFTKRVSEDIDEIVVGGIDKYLAVCRKCYNI